MQCFVDPGLVSAERAAALASRRGVAAGEVGDAPGVVVVEVGSRREQLHAGEAVRGHGSQVGRAERLIDVTYESLMRGVAAVKPGHTTGHIGAAIQSIRDHSMAKIRPL